MPSVGIERDFVRESNGLSITFAARDVPRWKTVRRFSGSGVAMVLGLASTRRFVAKFANRQAKSRRRVLPSTVSRFVRQKEERIEATMQVKRSPDARDTLP